MAIAGIGTDIVQISRLRDTLSRSSRFAERVLTANELAEYSGLKNPERFLAKRFAAKEAAAKALGTGIGRGVSFQHIEVTHTDTGAPELCFSGEFARLCESRNITHQFISIADEQEYAVATVVLESR